MHTKLFIRLLVGVTIPVLLANGQKADAADDEDVNTRIIGGNPTTISNVPYIVSLRYNGSFTCGGSLVSSRHVVTAAHCVVDKEAKYFTVTGGATMLTQDGVKSDVTRIVTAKRFSLKTLNKDVAVLTLGRALKGKNIKPIALCNRNWKSGDTMKVSGWGYVKENAKVPSNLLRTVKVPVISRKACQKDYKGILTNSMFCASLPGKRDACSGDSGGPAVFKGRLCGIVSFGEGCALKNFPGVYTNVNAVKKLIRKALKKTKKG